MPHAAVPPARRHAVALVGPPGSGRSELVRRLVAAAGAPVPDPSPRLTAAALEHDGHAVVLLDAPGDPDLVGDLRAALRGADAVLLVVSAVGGLDLASAALWQELADAGVPRGVVVTQLDRPRADFDEAVAVCQRVLGEDVLPLHLPMHAEDGSVAGLLDLVTLTVSDWSSGERVDREPDVEHVPLVENARADLVEAVLAESEDDSLLDRYVDGEQLDVEVVVGELLEAVRTGRLVPAVASAPGLGAEPLLDLLVRGLPSAEDTAAPPVAHPDGSPAAPLEPDPDGPLVAEVLAVRGEARLVRVWSGTLDGAGPGAVVEVDGLSQRPGEVVGEPLVLEPWDLPVAQHPVGVEPHPDLARRVAADPVARLEPHPETGQLLLWCAGPRHAEVLLDGPHGAPVQVPRRDGEEPWHEVRVSVPAGFAGAVRSDLAGRRATVTGTEAEDERATVVAELPEAELVAYAVGLRAVSHGTGRFVRRPLGWRSVED